MRRGKEICPQTLSDTGIKGMRISFRSRDTLKSNSQAFAKVDCME
jgi:hypothetical protein